MSTRYDTIAADDGRSFQGYVSEPARPNGHAVILLQEIFGVTKHVRAVADRFAEDGYLAVAPDLFWRMAPGVELSHSKEDVDKAMGFLKRYTDAEGQADVRATALYLRQRPGFAGKVAVAGLCLGGKLAYLAATMPEVDAAVAFYGVGIETRLDVAWQVRCPLLMHFGGQDPYVSEAARAVITTALVPVRPEIHVYPDANHGFYTRGAPADIDAARERTNGFLLRALAG
jgi:carboxymethylenebutenolidase